jgi:hypothetical protein
MAAQTAEADIPVLDISNADKALAVHLVKTVSKYGFVYIKNNLAGIPVVDIDSMFETVSTFNAHCNGSRTAC